MNLGYIYKEQIIYYTGNVSPSVTKGSCALHNGRSSRPLLLLSPMKKLFFIITTLALFFSAPTYANGTDTSPQAYTLAAGDTLRVAILNHDNLDNEHTIAPDGSVYFPLLGRRVLDGMSLEALETDLQTSYGKYLTKPQLFIELKPRPIYVVWRNVQSEEWTVQAASSVAEATALLGSKPFTKIDALPASETQAPAPGLGDLAIASAKETGVQHGDVLLVNVGRKPSFLETYGYHLIAAVGLWLSVNGN